MRERFFNPCEIRDEIKWNYEDDIVFLKGKTKSGKSFDEFIIGTVSRCGDSTMVAYEEMIDEEVLDEDVVVVNIIEGEPLEILCYIEEQHPNAIIATGFDESLFGVAKKSKDNNWVAVYNMDSIIDSIMKENDISEEEAIEFYEFNISGAYVGPMTPMFLDIMREDLG
jgi:predicted ThiF/HesA family dinucleotide-utilizing enzyme